MAIDVKNYRSSRCAAVSVVSKEELVMVLEFFEKEGYRWVGGDPPTVEMAIRQSYREYGDKLCISFYETDEDEEPSNLSYSDIEYFERRGYDIFSAEELLGLEAPEMEDIATLF